MRIRTFLFSLALAGFGFGAMAAVPPAMGYVTITCGPGIRLAANPLKVPDNRVVKLFAQASEGTEIYTLSNGKFSTNRFSSGVWTNPDQALEPGEGFLVYNRSGTQFRAIFQGEILTGNLDNTIPSGLSIKSSKVPQRGGVMSALGLRLAPFDNVYRWRSNRFDVYTFLPNGTWMPSEPDIEVGEAFFIRANQELRWTRAFTIN